MYFEIEGSKVRLAGTMHRVPQGRPLAHWVNDAIGGARLIVIEHEEYVSKQGQFASPSSPLLSQRLPRSWSRIDRQCRRDLVVHLKPVRPRAAVSYLLDCVPIDSGVEHLALARSRAPHPPRPRIEYLETAPQSDALECRISSLGDHTISLVEDHLIS